VTPRTAKIPPPKLVGFFESFAVTGNGWNRDETDFASQCQMEAIQMASSMIAKEPGYSLSLLGQTGSGKTMLAKLLTRFWNRCVPRKTYEGREPPSHYSRISWPDHDWRELERDAEMVMVDEVGRGERGKNGAEWSRFLDFFNFRVERRLWTVITSNLTWDEIRKADPAIASRMRRSGGVVLQAGAGVRPFEDRKP